MPWQKLPIQPGDNIQDADRFREIVDAVNERKYAMFAVYGGSPPTPISMPAHVQQWAWWWSVQSWIESYINVFVVNHDQYGNRITPLDYDGAVDDAQEGYATYTFPKWTVQQMFQSMGITGWTRVPRGAPPTTGRVQVRDYITADLFNEIMRALDRMELMELLTPAWYHWDEEEEEWVWGLYEFGPPQRYYYDDYYGWPTGWKPSLAEAKWQAEGSWQSIHSGAPPPGLLLFQRWAGIIKRIYPYPPEDPDNPVYQWMGEARHIAPSAAERVGMGVELYNRPRSGAVYFYWSGRATTEPWSVQDSVFDAGGYPIEEDRLKLIRSQRFSSGGPQTFVAEITMGESPPSFPPWPNEPPDPIDGLPTVTAAGWMERSRKALVRWNFTRLTPIP